MLRRRRIAPFVLAACLTAAPPLATAGAAQVLSAEPPPPPYEEQLLRLSEILGAIHYLRHLCEHDEKDTWRAQMAALIDAEEPDDLRRARMIDRFNRGHEGFRAVYRNCTPAAATSADRYLEEGAKIAADITARYGK
jgi:uncharacterized protein (TIGR02301 family)